MALLSGIPPMEPLPGAEALLAVHAAQIPQPDQLCGAFWAACAVHAVAPECGPVDLAAAAAACGSWVFDADLRRSRPPAEPPRRHGWAGALRAAGPDGCGTSSDGVRLGIAHLSGGAAQALPVQGPPDGPWTADEVTAVLNAAATPGAPVVVLANLDTGLLWGSHQTDRQRADYLATGQDVDGPPPDWSVGHFVALWGRSVGLAGCLIAVADTYPSLGDRGRHLQPVSRVAAALSRDAPGRGGLLVVARAEAAGNSRADLAAVEDAVRRVVSPDRVGGTWDNGSPAPPSR